MWNKFLIICNLFMSRKRLQRTKEKQLSLSYFHFLPSKDNRDIEMFSVLNLIFSGNGDMKKSSFFSNGQSYEQQIMQRKVGLQEKLWISKPFHRIILMCQDINYFALSYLYLFLKKKSISNLQNDSVLLMVNLGECTQKLTSVLDSIKNKT